MITETLELNKIYNMDCVEGMKMIPDNSIDLILNNRNYIGFELSKEYCEIAEQRIKEL